MGLSSRGGKSRESEDPFTLHQENGSSLDTSLPPSRATASPHRARTTLGVRPRLAGLIMCQATPEDAFSLSLAMSETVSCGESERPLDSPTRVR